MIVKERVKGERRKPASKKKELDGREVEIIFYAPEAKEVFLAGEFNQWNTRSLPILKKIPPQTWLFSRRKFLTISGIGVGFALCGQYKFSYAQ